MSALAKVREKFGILRSATDNTDKNPSVSSVSPSHEESRFSRRAAADLARRIRAMAARWRYSDADLAETLEAARHDPAGWLVAVQADEDHARKLHQTGLPFRQ